MRILIVGASSKYAIERPYVKYLSENEQVTAIEFFTAQDLFLEYYNQGLLNKLLYRIGISRILTEINTKLKVVINSARPEVVVIFKGMEILPDTLKWIRSKQIKLVNYNPDNPFIFSGRGSGNKNVRESISLYDLHLTYDKQVKHKLETEYDIPTGILPFGFDVSESAIENSLQEREILKVCFVGNPDRDRASFIKQLANRGVYIDVYGNHWGEIVKHDKIVVYPVVYGDEFWVTLRKYRVQLNLMRPHNPDSHNMRTFEIPGIGGIQLAPDTLDHRTYFEVDKEIFLFRDISSCENIIKSLIGMSVRESNEIRKRARERSVNSRYTYKDRADQLFREIKKLRG